MQRERAYAEGSMVVLRGYLAYAPDLVVVLPGYLAHKKHPPVSLSPRNRATVGSYGGVFLMTEVPL